MQPLILFDFDGTLVDSKDLLVSVINQVARKRGYKETFSSAGLREHTVRKLLREMGVSFFKLPGFLEECHERFGEQMAECSLQPGIKEFVKDLSKHATLGIVSSEPEECIRLVLAEHGLADVFAYVVSGSYFSKNKQLKQVRKDAVVDKFFTLYVGDESRDVHAARRAGVDCLAVTWGLQGEDGLLRVRPRMLACSVGEAEQLVKAWIVSRGD